MEIKIEKGIPIPIPAGRQGAQRKNPFDEMEIGDSFLVAEEKIRTVRSLASFAKKKSGMKVATRKVDGGFRVWRIE